MKIICKFLLTSFFQILILTFLSGCLFVGNNYSQEWKKLKPLVTTKTEVKKIFKNPSLGLKHYEVYQIKDSRIRIWYSHGYCREKDGLKWNVRPNLVTIVSVSPGKSDTLDSVLKSVGMDLASFTKKKHPTADGRFFYFSSDESLILQTYFDHEKNKESIYGIELYPGKDKQNLLCK